MGQPISIVFPCGTLTVSVSFKLTTTIKEVLIIIINDNKSNYNFDNRELFTYNYIFVCVMSSFPLCIQIFKQCCFLNHTSHQPFTEHLSTQPV